MRYFWSVPSTDEQRNFFGDYAKFSAKIQALGFTAQSISGLTESVIFYSIGYDTFLPLLGANVAVLSGVLFMFLGVALIELFGLRVCLPQATRQVIYKRWQGAHLAMSVFILLITALLIVASFYLSFDGSSHTVKSQVQKIKNVKADEITHLHELAVADVLDEFTQDSTEIETRYAALIATTNQKYNGEFAVAQSDLQKWASKKGNYKSRVNKALTNIESIKASRAADVAQLQAKKSNEQKILIDASRGQKDSLQAVYTANLGNNQNKYDATEKTFSRAAWWSVLLSIILSIVCIILNTIYKKGSGQKETPLPTDSTFRRSAIVEGWQAWRERVDTSLRNRIARFENKTPQPEISKRVAPVYDRGDLRELVIKLKVEQLSDDSKTIQLAVPELPKQVRKIGFHSTGGGEKPNAIVRSTDNTVNSTARRLCDECSTDISHKRSDARFCGVNCRKKWHSKRHGGNEFDENWRLKQ